MFFPYPHQIPCLFVPLGTLDLEASLSFPSAPPLLVPEAQSCEGDG